MKNIINEYIKMNTALTIWIIMGIISMAIVMIYNNIDIIDQILTITGLFIGVIAFSVLKIEVKSKINDLLEEMEETIKES